MGRKGFMVLEIIAVVALMYAVMYFTETVIVYDSCPQEISNPIGR